MTRLQRASVILSLGMRLKESGSWTGETHIQKSTYFLETLLGVPTDFKFILYKHGPFSFDLREFLTYMESEDFVKWVSQPPYGPSLKQGELGKELTEQFGEVSGKYASQIDFVAKKLARKNVAELERVATALYVTVEEEVSGNRRVQRIKELKPHIDQSYIESALHELDQMMKESKPLHIE